MLTYSRFLAAMAIVVAVLLTLNACGDGNTRYDYGGNPSPPPASGGGEADEEQAIAVASVVKNCNQCHGSIQQPFLRNEREILAQRGRICARVGDSTMPPPGSSISNGDKRVILDGLCN